jgi:hypothetical protein
MGEPADPGPDDGEVETLAAGAQRLRHAATFWPYNLTPSLKNYDFDMMDGGGWESYFNSLPMAGLTALFGTAVQSEDGSLVVGDSHHYGMTRSTS